MRSACASHTDWQARIAAGIQAAVEFAEADPVATWALTAVNATSPEAVERHRRAVGYFSGLLEGVAPPGSRLPVSTDEALINGIAALVGIHVRAGTEGDLAELAPSLVYLTLLPYAGYDRARDYAESLPPLGS